MLDDRHIDLTDYLKSGRHAEVQIVATSIAIGLLIAAVAFAAGPGGAAIAAAAMAVMVATGHISEDDMPSVLQPVEIRSKEEKRKSKRPRA